MEKAIRLYPSVAPGSEKLTIREEFFVEEKNGVRKEYVQNVTTPELIPYVPEGRKDMSAVIIIPGGAFMRQVLCHEGRDVAAWLNERGIAAFVLKTRLPVDEHSNKYDVLLLDAQRAVRTVRAHAAEWGIRKDSIGVMGFSAGGYQTALIATGFDVKLGEPLDEVDTYSARPDFCVLGYPAVAEAVQVRRGEETGFYIAEYEKEQLAKYKPHEMLGEDTPPLFIFDADDDNTTPPENSVLLYLAAHKKKVPAELHIFKTGKHGFGLGNDAEQTGQWKSLFRKWAETVGISLCKQNENGQGD